MRETDLPITGLTMLFSAGTFLYVATVHVLNEVVEGKTHSPVLKSGDQHYETESGLSRGEVVCIVAGSLLPLLFNIIHAH